MTQQTFDPGEEMSLFRRLGSLICSAWSSAHPPSTTERMTQRSFEPGEEASLFRRLGSFIHSALSATHALSATESITQRSFEPGGSCTNRGHKTSSAISPMHEGRMQVVPDFLQQLLSDYPIQQCILSALDIKDIINLSRTCKELSGLMKAVERRMAFSINGLLGEYFENPRKFRKILGQARGLICGPIVNHFFGRRRKFDDYKGFFQVLLEDSDANFDALDAFLQAEGYNKVSETEREKVYVLPHSDGAAARTIVVPVLWVTEGHPVICPALYCNTSAHVCFISWNKAYSLFPRHAHVWKETYLLGPYGSLSQGIYEEEMQDARLATMHTGLRVKNVHFKDPETKEIVGFRRVGDKYTWVIDLDTDKVDDPGTPDAVIESTTFHVEFFPVNKEDGLNRRLIDHYKLSADCWLSSPVLKYRYMFAGDGPDTLPALLEQRLKRQLEDLTRLQLGLIPPGNRPANFDDLVGIGHRYLDQSPFREPGDLPGFVMPPRWQFYDDEVLECLQEAWEKMGLD